jgi:hypothetical protein
MALVGLDVHRAQSVAAVLDPVSGELRVERLRGEPAVVVPGFLERLGRPVRAIYEAGPTGFGLARAATERGLDVRGRARAPRAAHRVALRHPARAIAAFGAPGGQRLAVYELTRPRADARLGGRHDFGPGSG